MSNRVIRKRGGRRGENRPKNEHEARRKQGLSKDILLASGGRNVNIVRGPGVVESMMKVVTLHWSTIVNIVNNAAVYGNERWYINNPYDCDPTVGTTAVPGLSEEATFYHSMRVIKTKVRASFTNKEAIPLRVYLAPALNFGVDPGADSATAFELINNPYALSRQISAAGGGKDTTAFVTEYVMSKLFSNQVLTDDAFASGTTAALSSSYRCYFVAGFWSPTATTTAGVTVSIDLEMQTMFYDRITLTS